MLEVTDLKVTFGGLVALGGISFTVEKGEAVGIIGPNGAGKTTTFRAISGTVPVDHGAVTFLSSDLLAMKPHQRALAGIAHVPEGRRVFPLMTVNENLIMGARQERGAKKEVATQLDTIYSIFPALADRRAQMAGNLSGGEQQMLALGRGLMSNPALIMLDEPSMGLGPAVADAIFEKIREVVQGTDAGLLIVEQRAQEALELTNRAYVLENGAVALSGPSDEIRKHPLVRRAYLGL